MEQRKAQHLDEKRKDQREGAEYQRLAQQYALEQIETDRFRKMNQKDVKTMYDQALEDKQKIKHIEQELDEVKRADRMNFILLFLNVRIGRR